MSKSVRNIIITAAAIVLLVIGIVIINNIEPKTEENTAGVAEDIYTIFEEGAEEVNSVEVKNGNSVIKAVKSNDSEWTIDGLEAKDIDSSKAYGLVGTVSSLTSKNKIDEAPSDLSQYGLASPQVTVAINKKNGKTDTLYIGDMSPTLGEYFIMKEGDSAVYTMYAFKVETLKQPLEYYQEFNRFNIVIDDITDIKIARNDETIEIKILDSIDKNTNNVWEMVSPYKCGANDDYIDNKILSPIEEITLDKPLPDVDGGFSDSSPVLTLRVKPYDNLTNKYGNEYTETLTVGRTDGDKTYVRYNDNVFLTPAESISFVNDSSFNIASKLQALVDISTVKSVTVEYNGNSHEIGIKSVGEETEFTLDGKDTDNNISRKIYQNIVGLTVDGIYKNETLGNTLLKIVYRGIESGSDTVVEIKEIDDINCALARNGKTEFTIKKNKVTDFIDLFETYVQNPQ